MLSAVGLTKIYQDQAVVSDVSLDFKKGELVSLLGPNGAGKSTFLNMISRLTKADGGSVLLDDKKLEDYPSYELSKRMAILTQSVNISSKLTVRELIALGRFPHCRGHLREEDVEAVEKALHFLELEPFAERFLDELSGGQRQRALIAMVLAQDTDYVLLDEPTNNLDIYHSAKLMQTLRRLCDELGKGVIMVLHEINYASFYSDKLVVLKNGRLAGYGTVDEIMQAEFLSSVYGVDFSITRLRGRPLALYF